MRPFLFALAAAGALAGAALWLPPALRPGVPVRRFRDLPRAVASDLNRRGCNIAGAKNVVSGDFTGTGRSGWAVLCRQGDTASLVIYAAPGAGAAVLNTHTSGLVDDPEAARSIRIPDRGYVARHNPGIPVEELPATCIEDGVGMGSSIYCYRDGTWVMLAGAD